MWLEHAEDITICVVAKEKILQYLLAIPKKNKYFLDTHSSHESWTNDRLGIDKINVSKDYLAQPKRILSHVKCNMRPL